MGVFRPAHVSGNVPVCVDPGYAMTSLLPTSLFEDVRSLIAGARARAAAFVNAELTLLYWQVGRRVREDVLLESGPGTGSSWLRRWHEN